MEIGGLSLTGLLFATGTSVTNVVTDVSRKKALEGCDLIAALACMKFFSAIGYAIVLGARLMAGNQIEIRDSGPLFGFESLSFSPPATFLIYLLIDVSLVGIANVLYFRALQVSPLSLCMPFIAFTPIFLIPTGLVLLKELPSKVKLIGVVLVVVGSLIMHRQLFAVSWAEPLKAIIRERGSRYMLIVAFIFSLTNPLDAKLVRMSHAFTHAFVFGLSFFIMFGAATLVRKSDWRHVMRTVPYWAVLAGLLEAVVNILQFSSHNYIAVVITISLKRAGIVLAVLMGWLIFKERGITDKLIASTVMVSGALMFYLPMSLVQSLTITCLVLIGMTVALYLTRHRGAAMAAAPPPTPATSETSADSPPARQ
jgi:uncharacterized membrane protein